MRTTEIGPLARRRWRRSERRVIAAYQRELVSTLRRLGDEGTPVSRVEIVAGRTGTMLSLKLPQHRLALAGTAVDASAPLYPPHSRRAPALVLSGAGRYRRAWWLSLTVGGETCTVLGSHIRLIPDTYGHTVRDDVSAPSAACLGARPSCTVS
ncbi:MAG: hypothetical protein ABSC41_06745 [Acidimicrobiales bacterium]|jgi:hypothetical protein